MKLFARALLGTMLLSACAFAVAGLLAPAASADPSGQPCGGFAGIPCPDGFTCVDVPGDGCNPNHGGADCPGRCRRSH